MNQQQYSENVLAQSIKLLESSKQEKERKVNEYEKLGREMLEMAKHSSQEVKIPITQNGIAFFHGKTKHSNEVLVHLGNNYFVQRTAHECQDIIGRRVAVLNNNLDLLKSDIEKHSGIQDLFKEPSMANLVSGMKKEENKVQKEPETHWTEDGTLEINEAFDEDADELEKV